MPSSTALRLQCHTVLQEQLTKLATHLSDETARRKLTQETAVNARREVETECCKREHLEKLVEEQRRTASRVPELLQHVRDMENVFVEQQGELEAARQAKQDAQYVLGVEKQERRRLEAALNGISPVIVPSLVEAFARVAQLTNDVLQK